MAWSRLDDRSHENAKLLAVGLDGTGLHLRAVSWCSANLTDGLLPAHVVPALAPGVSGKDLTRIIARLTKVSPGEEFPLWEQDPNQPGLFVLHDFLEYNLPAATAGDRQARLHDLRAAAGRNGGQAKRKQT
jgi:hypothetical protein